MIIPHKHYFNNIIRKTEDINHYNIALFIGSLISNFFKPKFLTLNSPSELKGKLLFEVFTNCMIHIENLSKIMKGITIPTILISLKDLTIFLSEFNE
jgi:hypothetical protein